MNVNCKKIAIGPIILVKIKVLLTKNTLEYCIGVYNKNIQTN